MWEVVMAALSSRGAKFIPSLEGRGFLWQFCKPSQDHPNRQCPEASRSSMELNSAGLCGWIGARVGQILRISEGRSISGPLPKAGPMIQVGKSRRVYGVCLAGGQLRRAQALDRLPNSPRGRESRVASATGHPQPENSPAATASAGSILLGDSLAILEELAAGLDHCQTGDRHQMA